MSHNARSLASRDPALSALLGHFVGGDFGAEMGSSRYGGRYGGDFGMEFGAEFGYGGDYGADAAPATPSSPNHPDHPMHPANQAKMMALWKGHQTAQKRQQDRYMLLDPNHGSSLKVEGYGFSINGTVTALGTAQNGIVLGPAFPTSNVKPVAVVINTPAVGFLYVQNILISNVNVTLGGQQDAFRFGAARVGMHMRLPLLTSSTPVQSTMNYSGFVPTGFAQNASFLIELGLEGPATLAGSQPI